jgi:hypothetical protein
MQLCQICGAKSWGPLNMSGEVVFNGERIATAKVLLCDACGAYGLKSAVEHDLAAKEHLNRMYGPLGVPPLPDPFSAAVGFFKSAMPLPETRLERLTKAILSSRLSEGEVTDKSVYGKFVVALARCIETELDRESLLDSAPPQPAMPDADFGAGEGA